MGSGRLRAEPHGQLSGSAPSVSVLDAEGTVGSGTSYRGKSVVRSSLWRQLFSSYHLRFCTALVPSTCRHPPLHTDLSTQNPVPSSWVA